MLSTGRQAQRDDRGFTLTEFIVAMGVLSVLLAVFAVSVRVMASSAVRVRTVADTATQGRQAIDLLSRELAYATAANLPQSVVPSDNPDAGVGGSGTPVPAVYLELLSDAVAGGSAAVCSQWRLLPASDRLQTRQWTELSPTPTAWRTVARGVVNDPATQPPFGITHRDGTYTLSRASVDLHVRTDSGPVLQTRGTYTLRNSADAPQPTASAVCARPDTGQVSR